MPPERQRIVSRADEVFIICSGFVVVVVMLCVFGFCELANCCYRAFHRDRREADRLLAAAQYEEMDEPE